MPPGAGVFGSVLVRLFDPEVADPELELWKSELEAEPELTLEPELEPELVPPPELPPEGGCDTPDPTDPPELPDPPDELADPTEPPAELVVVPEEPEPVCLGMA